VFECVLREAVEEVELVEGEVALNLKGEDQAAWVKQSKGVG
jgi:hypothetical protein